MFFDIVSVGSGGGEEELVPIGAGVPPRPPSPPLKAPKNPPGGSGGGRAILVVAALGRLVRRVVRPGSGPVVHRQRLRVGEGIEIRHLPTVATNGSDPSGR